MRYLVSYDIACPKRRLRAARLLLGHGERVQESVYELDLSDSKWHRLAAQMASLVDPGADQWRGWRACDADHRDGADLGLPSPPLHVGATIV